MDHYSNKVLGMSITPKSKCSSAHEAVAISPITHFFSNSATFDKSWVENEKRLRGHSAAQNCLTL